MTTPRHGPEAIEKAIIGYTQRQIANAPKGATGVYVRSDSVSYGYHTSRDKSPSNYIFFDAPPTPAYDEPIRASRALADDGPSILLEMNPRQAHALFYMSGRILGDMNGPRGAFDSIYEALATVAGQPEGSDLQISCDNVYPTISDNNVE